MFASNPVDVPVQFSRGVGATQFEAARFIASCRPGLLIDHRPIRLAAAARMEIDVLDRKSTMPSAIVTQEGPEAKRPVC